MVWAANEKPARQASLRLAPIGRRYELRRPPRRNLTTFAASEANQTDLEDAAIARSAESLVEVLFSDIF